MFLRRKRLRPILLVLFGIFIIAEIVALSPSSLEETKSMSAAVDPETLIMDDEPTLVPGIPKGRIAEYSIEKFDYVSVQNGEKQWKIEAKKAFLYNPERMVHSRTVKANLYDPDGKITVVTGLEARYYLNKKDLEIYGNVKTIFPDGFELDSEYLRYKPTDKHIEIPTRYLAHGVGQETVGQSFRFDSMGLDYFMGQAQIHLLQKVKVTLERLKLKSEETSGVPDLTTIESDHCLINRNTNLANFTMNQNRPLSKQFVYITQPTLFTKARRADLNYGSFSQVLQYLKAYDDVLIKETGYGDPKDTEKPLRYATGGHADFDTHRDVIVITDFPQVYQGTDTVTGDIILMHRDTDMIEVEHSNAFSGGSE